MIEILTGADTAAAGALERRARRRNGTLGKHLGNVAATSSAALADILLHSTAQFLTGKSG